MKAVPLVRALVFAAAVAAVGVHHSAIATEAKERNSPGGEVSVVGRVNYPGRFQIASGETLSDVLKKAGGTSSEANGAVTISRKDDHGVQIKIQLSVEKDASFELKPGDVVFIRPAK